MYSRNSFGSYYPIDSIIHRLNPILITYIDIEIKNKMPKLQIVFGKYLILYLQLVL